MNIVTQDGKVAFTAENCPGGPEKGEADEEHMKAHAKRMTEKAQKLGIKTRYEVK